MFFPTHLPRGLTTLSHPADVLCCAGTLPRSVLRRLLKYGIKLLLCETQTCQETCLAEVTFADNLGLVSVAARIDATSSIQSLRKPLVGGSRKRTRNQLVTDVRFCA